MNTVYILWLRQLKRYYRSRSRVFGSLAQPLLFLFALGFGFGPVFQKAGGGNYIDFLAPGVIAQAVLFTAIFSGIELIWDRQFGFLKETLVAPVSRFSIMVGRTLGGATIATLQGIIVLILSFFAGFHLHGLNDIPVAIFIMFILALLFTAVGTAIASTLQDFQGFQLIMNFIVLPLFFLSGALFPLAGLPKALTIAARINPLSYGVDGLRDSLTNVVFYSLSTDILVISVLTLIVLFIGSFLFSKIEA